MSTNNEIIRKISRAVEELPSEKQLEVFDFAQYLKTRVKRQAGGNGTFADLVGIIDGPADLAVNHDEQYD